MQEKLKNQKREEKVKELGMPIFYAGLAEAVETIRELHPDVESYGLQKLFKLIKITKKIKKREYLDNHILIRDLFGMIHGDPKKSNEALAAYNKTMRDYNNGR